MQALLLIVEDNPGDVFIIKESLREYAVSCSVTVLSDGEQAANFFDRIDCDETLSCPSMVLLDLNLPKRSGHWVLRRIRGGGRCSSVPVGVINSSGAESDLIANKQLGATAYFRKPSSLDEFMLLGNVAKSLL